MLKVLINYLESLKVYRMFEGGFYDFNCIEQGSLILKINYLKSLKVYRMFEGDFNRL